MFQTRKIRGAPIWSARRRDDELGGIRAWIACVALARKLMRVVRKNAELDVPRARSMTADMMLRFAFHVTGRRCHFRISKWARFPLRKRETPERLPSYQSPKTADFSVEHPRGLHRTLRQSRRRRRSHQGCRPRRLSRRGLSHKRCRHRKGRLQHPGRRGDAHRIIPSCRLSHRLLTWLGEYRILGRMKRRSPWRKA